MAHGFPCFGCYSSTSEECQACRRHAGCMVKTFDKGELEEASS